MNLQLQAIGFSYTPRKEWKEYDLQTYDQAFNGKSTDLQAVVYKGNFVTFRHKNFHVFPTEDLFKTIDPIMKELGGRNIGGGHFEKAEPFEFVYGEKRKVQVEANYKYFNGKKYYIASQVRCNYVFENERFDVTGNGDIVNFGTSIANAIDGSMSMQISPYTERETCTNGMVHAASMVSIGEGIVQKLMKKTSFQDLTLVNQEIKSAFEESKSFDDLFTRIKRERMTHLTEIPLSWIRSRLYLVKETASLFKQRYRNMTELFVNLEQAEKIAASMPKRLVDKLEWLEVRTEEREERTEKGTIVKKERVVKLKNNVTQWKAFNDITKDLTHNQRAFDSRTIAYRNLDRILVVN